jgi:hypothetical protein
MNEEMQHTEIVPAALPPVIDEQAGAIDLYRYAVIALAGIGAVGLLGVLVLAGLGRDVPDGAIVLASVAVGALAGMIGGQAVTR